MSKLFTIDATPDNQIFQKKIGGGRILEKENKE
jgi:hypothetical protein